MRTTAVEPGLTPGGRIRNEAGYDFARTCAYFTFDLAAPPAAVHKPRSNRPQDALQKIARALMCGSGQDLPRAPLFDHPAVVEKHHPVRHLGGKAHLVGD